MTRPAVSLRLAAIAAIACSGLDVSAQSFTSPAGFADIEGDDRHFVIFNPAVERFMQVDDSMRGTPVVDIRAIAFRQDADFARPTGAARTLDLTVRMGHAALSSAASTTFASNWVGTPTETFTRKTVNVPDWSMLPPTTPAPFAFRAMFDTRWTYNGTDSIGYELIMENVSVAGAPDVDRELGTSAQFRQNVGTPIGFGCVVFPTHIDEFTQVLFLRNHGPNDPQFGQRFGVFARFAPLNVPLALNLDVADPNLQFPGLCEPLHASPGVSFPLGSSDGNGDLPLTFIEAPYNPVLNYLRFYTQLVAPWPGVTGGGLPFAVSDGQTATMPGPPLAPPATSYVYATTATAPDGVLFTSRAIVTELEF